MSHADPYLNQALDATEGLRVALSKLHEHNVDIGSLGDDLRNMQAKLTALKADTDYGDGLSVLENALAELARIGPRRDDQHLDWHMVLLKQMFPFNRPLPVRALCFGYGMGILCDVTLSRFMDEYTGGALSLNGRFPGNISAVLQLLNGSGIGASAGTLGVADLDILRQKDYATATHAWGDILLQAGKTGGFRLMTADGKVNRDAGKSS